MVVSRRWRIDPDTQWVDFLERESGDGGWQLTGTMRVCIAIADNEGLACPAAFGDDERDRWCAPCRALDVEVRDAD